MRTIWCCSLVLVLVACSGERVLGYLRPPRQVDDESSLGRLDAAVARALRATYQRQRLDEGSGDARGEIAGDPSAGAPSDPLEEVLLLVDTSASRAPVMGRQAELVRALVARLSPSTQIEIAAFDQDVAELYRGPARDAGVAADAILERGALGASDLGAALARAAASGARRVIVLGGGAPSIGETDPARLAALVRATAIERVDAIQIGQVRDREIMQAVVGAARRPGAILDGRDPDRLSAQLVTSLAIEQVSRVDRADRGSSRERDATGVQRADPASLPLDNSFADIDVDRTKLFSGGAALIEGDGYIVDGYIVDGPCYGAPDGPWFGLNGWESPIAPTATGRWFPPAPTDPPPYRGEFFEVMSAIARGERGRALEIASAWESRNPGDVTAIIALGEALEARGASVLASRAYGSIIDLYPERAELLRSAGERLDRVLGARKLAIDAYRRAIRERPDQIATYRLLAYDLMLENRPEALDVLFEGIARAQRPSVQQILGEDSAIIASYLLVHAPSQRAYVTARIRRPPPTENSLRFVVSWEPDTSDIDLHVRDGNGGHAFYGNRELPSGGQLLDDITGGFGPEMFEVVAPKAYPYHLAVHSYARGADEVSLGSVQIIRYDGPGRVTIESRPFVIENDDTVLDLGPVAVDAGAWR